MGRDPGRGAGRRAAAGDVASGLCRRTRSRRECRPAGGVPADDRWHCRAAFAGGDGGILLGRDYHFDLVRPGVGLYGGEPFIEARPVVTLSLPVVQIRDVRPGESVGYGYSWTATRPSRVATVAAGYADGLTRALMRDGKLRLWAGDRSCPVIGRISMDLITVDVTDLPDPPAALEILERAAGCRCRAPPVAAPSAMRALTSMGTALSPTYL